MSKRRKSKHRTRRARRPPKPSFSTRKRSVWAAIILTIACVAVVAVLYARFLRPADNGPGQAQPLAKETYDPVVFPAVEPIRTTEGLDALKEQELKLAEQLLQDFPGRDEALAIIGDVWYRHGDAVKAEKSWTGQCQVLACL